MMQKIINTMFYGSRKAKIFLWSVFVMTLATVLMGVLAAVMGSTVFLMGAVSCGVAAFITSQSVSLRELEKKEKKSHSGKEKNKEKARYLASMNEKKMKQVLKEHKVRQSHIFVMIDSYPKMQISQTPAVMWRTDTRLHLLVLDGGAREIEIPLQDIKGILYQKNIPADPQEDYPSFQYANFMSKLYKPFLPTYHEMTKEGEIRYFKNVFSIEPGISFTNTSMTGVMKILNKLPLLVNDAVNLSKSFDEYFKEVYRYSILCKNGVISLEEYRQKMERVLEALLTAPITGEEFIKSLRDMSRYHLTTSEYVTKYTQIYCKKNQLRQK